MEILKLINDESLDISAPDKNGKNFVRIRITIRLSDKVVVTIYRMTSEPLR